MDVAGTYVVELVVNDGEADRDADTVSIDTLNSSPVAVAGPDQIVALSELITLDGSVGFPRCEGRLQQKVHTEGGHG